MEFNVELGYAVKRLFSVIRQPVPVTDEINPLGLVKVRRADLEMLLSVWKVKKDA